MVKNITIQVIGGQPKALAEASFSTVRDAFEHLNLTGNYAASINGDACDMDDELEDFSFITFAPSVKGGASRKTKTIGKKPSIRKPKTTNALTKKACGGKKKGKGGKK